MLSNVALFKQLEVCPASTVWASGSHSSSGPFTLIMQTVRLWGNKSHLTWLDTLTACTQQQPWDAEMCIFVAPCEMCGTEAFVQPLQLNDRHLAQIRLACNGAMAHGNK